MSNNGVATTINGSPYHQLGKKNYPRVMMNGVVTKEQPLVH
ncbi:hypothetical protein [Planococcus sp. S3-L1]|nr:hypothetical protein [Planococcus sp. S3-L1]MDJ0332940.1 hypothetical protein [Planococcus sp. S3-L1]